MAFPRIFISHSSADDPVPVSRLHEVLTDAGFDVLLDRTRLAGGDEWRNEIYTWIARAHGAVVLITEAALCSSWVRFELAALASRLWLDDQFKLLPVVLKPLTVAALTARDFEPYKLAEIQADVIDADASDAFAPVVNFFQPLLLSFSDTPVDRLETTIMRELPREPVVLERAARLLAANTEDHELAYDAAAVARSMFHAAVESVRDALAEIAACHITRSQIQKIVDIVVPFWVDPQAIMELAREAAMPAGPHRVLLLNSRQAFLGKLYTQRAALQYPMKWEIVPVTNSGGDDLVGSVVAELRDHFRKIDALLEDATNAEIDLDIENTASIDPVIVIVAGGATPAHLSQLRSRYPQCIFLALVGHEIPDADTQAANQMTLLSPIILPDREQTIRTHYLACYRLVASTAG